jgi:putative N6-adenine-specific DNA methylase
MMHFFAVTVPGLELFARRKLASLGITSVHAPQEPGSLEEMHEDAGGVEFSGSLPDLYKANLHLRCANRILARVGAFFYATDFAVLRQRASRLPWEHYLHPGQAVIIQVTCHQSKLYHSTAVAERVADAIADRMGCPSPLVKPGEDSDLTVQRVLVRLVHDRCTVSMDSSGPLLHRRGYRQETAKAPLRETLAAGLLLASGWDRTSPLLDPFCGSGTIPIEAALMARNIAPGKQRHFAFMDWPRFDPQQWQPLLQEAIANERPSKAIIQASDRDAGAIRVAQANAERAGVLDAIQFSCQAFSAIEPPSGPGWVVTNPPYGVRTSPNHDLRNLYTHLGDVLRSLCPGWKIGLLCPDYYLAGHTRISFDTALPLVNGGIGVKFFIGKIGTEKL